MIQTHGLKWAIFLIFLILISGGVSIYCFYRADIDKNKKTLYTNISVIAFITCILISSILTIYSYYIQALFVADHPLLSASSATTLVQSASDLKSGLFPESIKIIFILLLILLFIGIHLYSKIILLTKK